MNKKGENNEETISENLMNLHESINGSLEGFKETVREGSSKVREMSVEEGGKGAPIM